MQRKMVAFLFAAAVCAAGCTTEETKRPAVPEARKPEELKAVVAPVSAFATIKEAAGTVKIRRGSEFIPAQGGAALGRTDGVLCEKDAIATVELYNGSLLRMSSGSYIRLDEFDAVGHKTTTVGLVLGRLWVKVNRLVGGRKFEVNTATAVAGIRGTVFQMAVAADGSTRVGIEEGFVEVRAKTQVKKLEKDGEVVVEAASDTVAQDRLKLNEWDSWLSARNAEVMKDPIKVASIYVPEIKAAGGAVPEALRKAEAAVEEMRGAEGSEKERKRGEVIMSMDEVRAAQDRLEIQMDLMGRLLIMTGEGGAPGNKSREAFEAEYRKARESAPQPAETSKKLKDITANLKPAVAAAKSYPEPVPSKTQSGPGVHGHAGEKGGAADSRLPREVQEHAIGPKMKGFGQITSRAAEAVKDMQGEKVAAVTEQPPREAEKPVRKTAMELADYEKAFKDCEAKLESIAGHGEVFDNKARAGMVKTEGKKLSAMLTGLRALATDLEKRSKEAKDATEGRGLFEKVQKGKLLAREIEAKVQWCEAQARHYEEMKAE